MKFYYFFSNLTLDKKFEMDYHTQVERRIIMANERNYIEMLEAEFFNLLEMESETLLENIRKNKSLFSFISDRSFSSSIIFLNFDSKKIAKKIDTQLKLYGDIIGKLKKLEDMPLSDDAQHRVFTLISGLIDPAINLGYCEEASELLKIVKNPKINKIFCDASVSSAVLRIIDAYGKRAILEDDPKYKANVDAVIVDVVAGEYGKDTRKKLSVSTMEKAYSNARVIKGDIVLKVDGTHEAVNPTKK